MPRSVYPFQRGERFDTGQLRDHLNELVGAANDQGYQDQDVPLGYRPQPFVPVSFWAQITGTHGTINGPLQWYYGWTAMSVVATGAVTATFSPTGVLSGTSALNMIEALHTGTHRYGTVTVILGNSIQIGGSGTTFFGTAGEYFAVQPARGTPVVKMWVEMVGTSPVYAFEYVNQVDGSCA